MTTITSIENKKRMTNNELFDEIEKQQQRLKSASKIWKIHTKII